MSLLAEWKLSGDRIIICIDANEDIYRRMLGRTLTDKEGLDMVEVVGHHTGRRLGATYFRGSWPIDTAWASKELTVVGAQVMPCGYGMVTTDFSWLTF